MILSTRGGMGVPIAHPVTDKWFPAGSAKWLASIQEFPATKVPKGRARVYQDTAIRVESESVR